VDLPFRPGVDAWPGGPPIAAIAAGYTGHAYVRPTPREPTAEERLAFEQQLALFRATKLAKLRDVKDPIERLLRAAASCVSVARGYQGQQKIIEWDPGKLARYFPEFEAKRPRHGASPWNDESIKVWFLAHVRGGPTSQTLRVEFKGRLGSWKVKYFPGWQFLYGSVATDRPWAKDSQHNYRSLSILRDSRMVYQSATSTHFTSIDGADGFNAIALSQMAALCGLTDRIDEPKPCGENPLPSTDDQA
jgi:hypothetical protein